MLELVTPLIAPLVVLHVVIGLVTYVTLLERKFAARMQSRIGPYRVGPHGLLQPIADAIKLMMKEDVVPTAADKPVYNLAPIVFRQYSKSSSPSRRMSPSVFPRENLRKTASGTVEQIDTKPTMNRKSLAAKANTVGNRNTAVVGKERRVLQRMRDHMLGLTSKSRLILQSIMSWICSQGLMGTATTSIWM